MQHIGLPVDAFAVYAYPDGDHPNTSGIFLPISRIKHPTNAASLPPDRRAFAATLKVHYPGRHVQSRSWPMEPGHELEQACRYYLMYSYAYYHGHKALIPDAEYDALCRHLYDNFATLPEKYAHLMDKDALAAGTGYHIRKEDYPEGLAAWVEARHLDCIPGRQS